MSFVKLTKRITMFKNSLHWVLLSALGIGAIGCEKAETNIVEKASIVESNNDHDHDHDLDQNHVDHGRLVVVNNTTPEAAVYNLEDKAFLDAFSLPTSLSSIYASGDHRYAVLVDRDGDFVGFLDGGVWQEVHVDHLDDYEESPVLLDYTLSGVRPTHVINHEGQLAIFFDGDAATSSPASVSVITDADIGTQNPAPLSMEYNVNMHGVAEPRGEHLIASWRRDDAETTSTNPILPDQIAVYHLHDGEYEQEQILAENCPDLHGAAQNETYVAFGCSDGVLLVQEHEGVFEAHKIVNPDSLAEGLRVGSIYGHENSDQFIGLASAHGGADVQWLSIDPTEGEIALIDWQPMENARVVDRGFSFEAEQFLILDNQGYLTALEPHEHDGHIHWEFGDRLDITDADVADMPEEMNFTLAFAQNGHTAYVADPIAQHIVMIDLDLMEKAGEIDLGFAPSAITWLGIGEIHDHE